MFLIPTSAESLIQVNDALYLVKAIGHLRQLGRKQRLLRCEYFQISGSAMLH